MPAELWDAATAKTRRHGVKGGVSEVVRDRLEEYARPSLMPGDQIRLSGLEHGPDGVYVIEEGPIHGVLGEKTVTLRMVQP
jgi:hypothetical protein